MQEIIVYRNPVEAAIWGNMSNDPALVLTIFTWAFLTVVGVVLFDKIITKINGTYIRRHSMYTAFVTGVPGVIAALISWNLFH